MTTVRIDDDWGAPVATNTRRRYLVGFGRAGHQTPVWVSDKPGHIQTWELVERIAEAYQFILFLSAKHVAEVLAESKQFRGMPYQIFTVDLDANGWPVFQ